MAPASDQQEQLYHPVLWVLVGWCYAGSCSARAPPLPGHRMAARVNSRRNERVNQSTMLVPEGRPLPRPAPHDQISSGPRSANPQDIGYIMVRSPVTEARSSWFNHQQPGEWAIMAMASPSIIHHHHPLAAPESDLLGFPENNSLLPCL